MTCRARHWLDSAIFARACERPPAAHIASVGFSPLRLQVKMKILWICQINIILNFTFLQFFLVTDCRPLNNCFSFFRRNLVFVWIFWIKKYSSEKNTFNFQDLVHRENRRRWFPILIGHQPSIQHRSSHHPLILLLRIVENLFRLNLHCFIL